MNRTQPSRAAIVVLGLILAMLLLVALRTGLLQTTYVRYRFPDVIRILSAENWGLFDMKSAQADWIQKHNAEYALKAIALSPLENPLIRRDAAVILGYCSSELANRLSTQLVSNYIQLGGSDVSHDTAGSVIWGWASRNDRTTDTQYALCVKVLRMPEADSPESDSLVRSEAMWAIKEWSTLSDVDTLIGLYPYLHEPWLRALLIQSIDRLTGAQLAPDEPTNDPALLGEELRLMEANFERWVIQRLRQRNNPETEEDTGHIDRDTVNGASE